MATRTISTKLAVEGESEYRASLSRINVEIKSLQSALKLTESQFKTNANSLEALTAKGNSLKDLYGAQAKKVEELRRALDNARAAEADYAVTKATLNRRLEENKKALEALGERTDETAAEYDRLTAENKELNRELETTDAKLDAAGRGADNWQAKLNTAQIKLNDLDAEIKLNNEYLEEARASADNCATSIDRFGKRAQTSAEEANELRDALMSAGLIKALQETAEAFEACVDASVEFESAMAGVKKTTDMSEVELASMGDAIQKLATRIPATTTEIANVTEAAGQLGIAKDSLLEFTEVMVNLGVATNLASTEAASALAKFANVVNMSADDYDRLGSTIVHLGNNFATTEADIVSMATRLASSGSIVGLSEADIMAIATALSSVGIEAEAGGSAVSKLLKMFEVLVQTAAPGLADFAAVAGMSADEFSAAWGENAVQALSLFVDGLGKVDAAGGSSVAILEDLGITEVRLSNAVLAMASSKGILSKALNTANSAWVQNTALATEAATRYATTESKLILLSNAANNAKIAVGDQLTPAISELAVGGADVLNWAAEFIEEHEMIVPLVTSTATAIGVLAAAIVGYTAVTKAAAAMTTMFNAAMGTNPIFRTVTAVAALAAGIGVLAATIDDGSPSVKELATEARSMGDTVNEMNASVDEAVTSTMAAANVAEHYITRLQELEATGTMTDAQQKEYHNILLALCRTVPELSAYIDTQTDSIMGGTEVLLANTEAWKQNAIQQAYQERVTALTEKHGDVLYEAAVNTVLLTEAQTTQRIKIEEQNAVAERMNELMAEASAEAERQFEEFGALVNATDLLTQEYYDLEEEYRTLGDEIQEAEQEENRLTKAIEEDTDAIAAAEEEIELAEKAMDALTGATEENTEAAEKNATAMEDSAAETVNIVDQIKSLAESYSEAYKAAKDSIEGQLGLFGEFSTEISDDLQTIDQMKERWLEQADAIAQYTENLALAAQFKLDDDLLGHLSDGSAESAAYLAAIISQIQDLGENTQEATTLVNELNAAFQAREESVDTFASVQAALEANLGTAVEALATAAEEADFSGFESALQAAFANLDLDFSVIWTKLSESITSEEETGAVSEAVAGIVESAVESAGEAMSESAGELGASFIDGMASGAAEEEDAITETVTSMGETLTGAMTEAATSSVNAFIEEFQKIQDRTNERIAALQATIVEATAGMPVSMRAVGQGVVDGMIAGLNDRESSLYARIRSIVNTSIEAAKEAAAVHSPSDKTTYIFEQVGEGMIVGAENKREKVKETLQSVVDEALRLDISGTATIEAAISRTNNPASQMEAALSQMASLAKNRPSGGVTNNFYPKSMSKSEVDYFVRKIIREMGSMV